MKKNSNIGVYILADYIAVFLFWFACYYINIAFFLVNDYRVILTGRFTIFSYFTIPLLFVLISAIAGTYQQIPAKKSRAEELIFTWTECLITSILLYFPVLEPSNLNYKIGLLVFVFFFLFLGILVSIFRMIYLTFTKKIFKNYNVFYPTIVIGNSEITNIIGAEINRNTIRNGYKYIGFISLDNEINSSSLGSIDQLSNIIRQNKVQQMILADEIYKKEEACLQLIANISELELEIRKVPDDVDFIGSNMTSSDILGIPLVKIETHVMPQWQRNIKRILDVLFSFIGMILLSPLIIFTYLKTKISSNGNVFYHQERVGKNGKIFKIIKFRSMYIDAEKEGPQLSFENDKRITPWGKVMRKWRLDELPQLYNILIGDMSFVGPRPERPFFAELINKEVAYYKYIWRIKPGLTSWGMVQFGYASNLQQMKARLKYDMVYLKSASLLIDLKITIYTIRILFLGKGK
ncbi:sugar transferase [Rhizosphaericola mali]|uniref:Sugar transferase n=1 Tax=Rhizosphaericola mali TaxID=2545455 RepID=A0A5P2GAN6_9BACT|nr:sugar transferase [Rhizosphaericola mali]QES90760.1 sugar transferase [Rhizosphaericola mali]